VGFPLLAKAAGTIYALKKGKKRRKRGCLKRLPGLKKKPYIIVVVRGRI